MHNGKLNVNKGKKLNVHKVHKMFSETEMNGKKERKAVILCVSANLHHTTLKKEFHQIFN